MTKLNELTFPYRIMAESEPPDNGNFGMGESNYQMELEVAYADEAKALGEILGISKRVGAAAPYTLSRTPPLQHPRYPRCWCTRVAVQPWVIDPGHVDVIPEGQPYAGNIMGTYGPYPPYKYTRLLCTFQATRAQLYTDAKIAGAPFNGAESYRYVVEERELGIETLQLPQGAFQYWTGTPDIPAGNDIPRVRPTVALGKEVLKWTWLDVPANWLLQTGTGQAKNLLAGIGKVNSATFHGYLEGTLLALPPKYTPQDAPVDGFALGIGDPTVNATYYKVEFFFEYLEPPIEAGYAYRGHNVVPHPTRPEYYLIVRRRVPLADDYAYRLYRGYDFEQFFRSAN
jgi:hypothetical protein